MSSTGLFGKVNVSGSPSWGTEHAVEYLPIAGGTANLRNKCFPSKFRVALVTSLLLGVKRATIKSQCPEATQGPAVTEGEGHSGCQRDNSQCVLCVIHSEKKHNHPGPRVTPARLSPPPPLHIGVTRQDVVLTDLKSLLDCQ